MAQRSDWHGISRKLRRAALAGFGAAFAFEAAGIWWVGCCVLGSNKLWAPFLNGWEFAWEGVPCFGLLWPAYFRPHSAGKTPVE